MYYDKDNIQNRAVVISALSREGLLQTVQCLLLSDLLPLLRNPGWLLLVFLCKSLTEPHQDIPVN